MFLDQSRLGVEGIDLRRPAVHVEEDDALRLGGIVRFFGSERVDVIRRAGLLTEHGRERDSAKPIGDAEQHRAAGGESGKSGGKRHENLVGKDSYESQIQSVT